MISYDANSGVSTGTTTWSWTHTPVRRPRGILVFIVENVGVSDVISDVTYGGVPMTRIGYCIANTAEPGSVYAYFLGSGIPNGAQTVEVTVSSGTTSKAAISFSVTGEGDTIVGGVAMVFTKAGATTIANPSMTVRSIPGYVQCLGLGAVFSGVNAPGSITPGSGYTDDGGALNADFGTQTCKFEYGTALTDPGVDVVVNWTIAAEDCAAIGVALYDVGLFVAPIMMFGKLYSNCCRPSTIVADH